MEQTSVARTMITRIVSPAGFLLVLVLFLFLPSVAVSCDAPADDSLGPWSVDISFTGTEIVLDEPTVHTSGAMARTPEWEAAYSNRVVAMDGLVRGLAVATVVLMAAGVGVAMVRSRRPLVAAVVAGAAGVLLVVIELLARARLEDAVRELLSALFSTLPESERGVLDRVGEAIETRFGFWLALAGLGLVLLVNLGLLVRDRRQDVHLRRSG